LFTLTDSYIGPRQQVLKRTKRQCRED